MAEEKKLSHCQNMQIQAVCNTLMAFNERLRLIEDINTRNTVFLHALLTVFDVGRGVGQTYASQCDRDTQQVIERCLTAMQERLTELIRNRHTGLPK